MNKDLSVNRPVRKIIMAGKYFLFKLIVVVTIFFIGTQQLLPLKLTNVNHDSQTFSTGNPIRRFLPMQKPEEIFVCTELKF